MYKISSILAIAAIIAVGAVAYDASAQTTTSNPSGVVSAPMSTIFPTLYDTSGRPVNTGAGTLPAGYYYLQPGNQANQQVYYYGNGTYYNPTIGEYGGSVNNPTGMAGFNYGSGTTGTGVTPGVPATGLGGQALATWLTLVLSAVIALGGGVYLASTRNQSTI